ncbi:MAG: DUF3021 domain-containing protein [Lachnospiraceae bacterium]|nr:DUF3021 domain-containing protein [Lachnospiraceae bacterium]
MTIKNILRSMLNDYFIICTGIIACQLVLRSIYAPDNDLTLNELVFILFGGAIFTLPHLSFLSNKELSIRQWKKRRVIHFIVLEITVVCCAYLFGWLEGANLLEVLTLMLSVLAVYVLVWLISWQIDKGSSELINRKLAEFHEADEETANIERHFDK